MFNAPVRPTQEWASINPGVTSVARICLASAGIGNSPFLPTAVILPLSTTMMQPSILPPETVCARPARIAYFPSFAVAGAVGCAPIRKRGISYLQRLRHLRQPRPIRNRESSGLVRPIALPLEDLRTVDKCFQHLRIGAERRSGKDHEVGVLSRFQRADVLIHVQHRGRGERERF